jgi:hypothetical protein
LNKLTRYLVALSLTLMAANAHAIPLADLYAGASIVVGDKLFADWEELNNESCSIAGCISGGVDTASIEVTGVGDGTAGNAYGLQFISINASLSATGDEFIDLWFRFSVDATDPTQRITGAVMTGTAAFQGDAHLMVVEKDIYVFGTSDHLAFMEIFSDPLDSPSLQLSDMADLGSQTKIWVEDNVFVDGFGGSAELVTLTQRFEQTVPFAPDIDIEKLTNGLDADDPNAGDAPSIAPGDLVSWTYLVTNTGNVGLTNVTVVDDQGVAVSCPQTTLLMGETMTCTASGIADDLNSTTFTTVPGFCGVEPNVPLYENIGSATGDFSALTVSDSDPSHYCNPRVNQAPVAVDNNYTGLEDNQLAGNVITDDTSEGIDSDVDGDGMSIDSNTDVSHGTLVLNADGSFTYDPTLNYCGPDSFTYVITDDPPATPPPMTSNTATVSITVTCVNDPPEVTSVVAGAQTSDYSDFIGTVVITVEDVDDTTTTLAESSEPPLSATGLSLTSTGCTVIVTESPDEDGSTCTWDYDGQVLDPGDNVHGIVFTPSDADGEGTVTGTHTLTIQPEDATADLDDDNPVAVEVAKEGGDSGVFSMFFSAWETSDPDDPNDGTAEFGNLNNAQGFITLNPVGPGGPITVMCIKLDPLPMYPAEGYGQVVLFECVFNEIPVNTYEVLAEVDGLTVTTIYYAGFDEGVLVIYDPSLGFTTGGGWFYWPGTCDEIEEGVCDEAGYPGDKTNFGFNMKYNKGKKKKPQGNLLLMRHTITDENYKVKSNALDGMAIGDGEDADGKYGWATVNGKSTFRPLGADTEGNHPFLLYIEDHDEQGCNQDPADEFWIEVRDPD